MQPALLLALIAAAVAAVVGLLADRLTGRRGPWAALAALAAGWLVLWLRGGALNLITIGLVLAAAWAVLGLARRLPRPIVLIAVLATLGVFLLAEYRRGDLYTVQCLIWAGLGALTWASLTLVAEEEPPAPLGAVTVLGGLYLAFVGVGLPNPGLVAFALLVAGAGLGLRGRTAAGVQTGLLFFAAFYAWLGYASPDMAMAPIVLLIADAAATLVRRAASGRLVAGRSLGGRVLSVLDARGDTTWSRLAHALGARAATATLLGFTAASELIALGEWKLRVAAVPGAAPFAALALLYLAAPALPARMRLRTA